MYLIGLRCLPVAVSAILLFNLPGHAADRYWDTLDDSSGLDAGNGIWDTGTTALWNSDSTGANSPLVTWANNDDAFFQTGGTNVLTLVGTIHANSLSSSVSATNTTLNGGTLQLNSTTVGINFLNAPTLTINSAVTVGASQAWQTSNGSTLIVNGGITGAGNALTLSGGGSGGNRDNHFNGTNTLAAISVTGTGSTARTLYLNGSTALTGTLTASGTQAANNARIFSGSNNSFGGVTVNTATIVLGGTNSITGTTLIDGGGILVIERDANIGAGSNTVTFDAGTLRIQGTAMNDFGTHNLTFVTSASTRLDIADAANVFTVNKVIGGATGTFHKLGKGTVVLNQSNTYGGSTIVRGGVLQIDNNAGGSIIDTATLTMNGGTFRLTGLNGGTTTQGTGAVTVSNYGSTIRVDGGTSTAATLNLGAITAATDGGTLNFVTTGTTTPTITTTTDKDATGIYGGRITFNGTNWATTASGGSPFTLSAYSDYNGGGTISTSGANALNSLVTDSAALTGSLTTNTLKIATTMAGQSLAVGAGNTLELTAGGLLFAGAHDYTISGGTLRSNTATAADLIVHQNGEGNLTISSAIANGPGGSASVVTKSGAGTLTLSGSNTYTGTTFINEGVLSVSNVAGANNNLGATAGTGLNLNGGTLQYTGVTATKSGAVTLGTEGGTFDITSAGTVLTLTGVIGENTANTDVQMAALTKKGAGTLLLNNSNSFRGGARIEAGILQLGNANALQSTFSIVNFSSGSTGTLRLNGVSTTLAGLNTDVTTPGTTFVENNHATTASTLTVNATFASAYAGTIRNGAAASLALAKTGGNTLTLSGENTYSGGTSVSAGTLQVNNTLGSGTGTGVVNVGIGGTLGGTGFIGGATTVDGKISPGNSAGTLTINNNLTLNDGSTYIFEGGDLIDVNGTLDLNNNWTLSLRGGLQDGGSITIFTYTTLAAAPDLAPTFDTSMLGFAPTETLSLTDTGSSIVLNGVSLIPEPSTFAMLLGGFGLLIGRRRA